MALTILQTRVLGVAVVGRVTTATRGRMVDGRYGFPASLSDAMPECPDADGRRPHGGRADGRANSGAASAASRTGRSVERAGWSGARPRQRGGDRFGPSGKGPGASQHRQPALRVS